MAKDQAFGKHVTLQTLQPGVLQLVVLEKRLNLLTSTVMEALIDALETLRHNREARVLIVRGAGERAFVGGADIHEMSQCDAKGALAFITRVHQCCHLLRALPFPSIAFIHGYCLGAGMELAASCDLRLGSTASQYGMPEVHVGLPSVVEAALLPHLIGWGKTRELLYRGKIICAQEAEKIGFLQGMAEKEALEALLQTWLDDLLRAGPRAVRIQKRLIESWLEPQVAQGIQAGVDAFRQCYDSGEPQRMLDAFIKRKKSKV